MRLKNSFYQNMLFVNPTAFVCETFDAPLMQTNSQKHSYQQGIF